MYVPRSFTPLSHVMLFGTLALLGGSGCDMVAGLSGPPPVFFVNPGDPRIAMLTGLDGSVFVVFGQKDATGKVLGVDAMKYQSPDELGTDAATWYFYDGTQRMKRIVSSNGTTLDFNWLSSTRASVTFVSGNGQQQLTLIVDFLDSGGAGAKPSRLDRDAVDLPTSRGGSRISLQVLDPVEHATGDKSKSTTNAQQAKAGDGTVLVNVTQCGEPVSKAVVSIIVDQDVPGTEAPASSLALAKPTETPGQYRATFGIFVPPNPGREFADECRAVVSKLNLACPLTEAVPPGADVEICLSLAVAIDVATIPSGEAVPLAAACAAGSAGLRSYCATLGKSPGPPGTPTPSVADVICESAGAVVDAAFQLDGGAAPVQIVASACFMGVSGSASQDASASGPTTINIELPDPPSPRVESFTVSPPDPGAGQGYTARAMMQCLPRNSRVIISVVGTDGFGDSGERTVPEGGSATLSIGVPAALEGGVADTITLIVNGVSIRTVGVTF